MFNTNSTKEKKKLRAGSVHENPETGRLQHIFQIDNRRAERFGSLLHMPQDVVTADTLWDMLQKKIRDARKPDFLSFSSVFSTVAFNHIESPMRTPLEADLKPQWGDEIEKLYKVFDELSPVRPERMLKKIEPSALEYNLEIPSGPNYNPFEGMSQAEIKAWGERFAESLKAYGEIIKLPENRRLNTRPEVKIESEDEFHERSRYRLVSDDDVPEGWNELQESLPPSLLDEDCVGGLGDWMARTSDDIQYILMGDTDHYNEDLDNWRVGGAYLESLKLAGATDLVIEYPLEAKPFIDDFYDGKISSKKALSEALSTVIPKNFAQNEYAQLIANAKQLGIRVHALDEQLLNPGNIKSPRFGFDRCAHDKVLSERIKECVDDRKTAILYGAAHYRYEGSLIEQLGVDNCKVVDVYSDLEDYKTASPALDVSSATYVPPYAYILDKETVVMTNGDYLRKKSANYDPFVGPIKMGAQEVEIEKFKSRFAERYTSESNPELNGVTLGSVVSNVYWYRRAVQCGFTIPSI